MYISRDMTGRVVIVTGANSGLGFETARRLCDGGNDVILACRNEGKGKDAVDKIIKANPNALATFMQVAEAIDSLLFRYTYFLL